MMGVCNCTCPPTMPGATCGACGYTVPWTLPWNELPPYPTPWPSELTEDAVRRIVREELERRYSSDLATALNWLRLVVNEGGVEGQQRVEVEDFLESMEKQP